MKKIILLLSLSIFHLYAQEKDSLNSKISLDFSGYVDTYYNTATHAGNDSYFLQKYKDVTVKSNAKINLALLKTQLTYHNFYAKIAIQTGTYAKTNYPKALQWLNEASIGVTLSTKSSIEVGILPSYIGFETATSATNLTASRSLLAENSPYYMTGVKFNHQFNEKWFLAIMLSNGWQIISSSVNKLPNFGSQVQFKSSKNTLYNWSTFIGDIQVNENYVTRFFSNFYLDKTWNDSFKTQIGFDIGWQKRHASSGFATWMSPVVINQYQITSKWAVAHRIEYYQDRENVLIQPILLVPFKTIGNSINVDYLFSKKIKLRTEGKWYHATENVLVDATERNNLYWLSTMNYTF